MLDWDRITGFDWGEGNLVKNAGKHGVSVGEAEQMFWNRPLIVAGDAAHSGTERRFFALGRSDAGRMLFAVFTLRAAGALIRVISVRDMSRKERRAYAQEPEAGT